MTLCLPVTLLISSLGTHRSALGWENQGSTETAVRRRARELGELDVGPGPATPMCHRAVSSVFLSLLCLIYKMRIIPLLPSWGLVEGSVEVTKMLLNCSKVRNNSSRHGWPESSALEGVLQFHQRPCTQLGAVFRKPAPPWQGFNIWKK